jgi:hypothetical protein
MPARSVRDHGSESFLRIFSRRGPLSFKRTKKTYPGRYSGLAAPVAGLLPARRARYSARKVKCSTFRYHLRDQDRPELPTRITRVQVTITASQ